MLLNEYKKAEKEYADRVARSLKEHWPAYALLVPWMVAWGRFISVTFLPVGEAIAKFMTWLKGSQVSDTTQIMVALLLFLAYLALLGAGIVLVVWIVPQPEAIKKLFAKVRNRQTILLIPHSEAKVRQLNISSAVLALIVLLLLLLFVGLLISVVYFAGRQTSSVFSSTILEARLSKTRESLQQLELQKKELESMVSGNKELVASTFSYQIRTLRELFFTSSFLLPFATGVLSSLMATYAYSGLRRLFRKRALSTRTTKASMPHKK